jgi:hypothetical protein
MRKSRVSRRSSSKSETTPTATTPTAGKPRGAAVARCFAVHSVHRSHHRDAPCGRVSHSLRASLASVVLPHSLLVGRSAHGSLRSPFASRSLTPFATSLRSPLASAVLTRFARSEPRVRSEPRARSSAFVGVLPAPPRPFQSHPADGRPTRNREKSVLAVRNTDHFCRSGRYRCAT